MSDNDLFLLSLSIIFAAILGIIRFRKIDEAYRPFIYYACASVFIEVLVYILHSKDMDPWAAMFLNISTLTEFYLLTWLFHNWGLFKRKKTVFISIIVVFFALYVSTLFIRGYTKRNVFAGIVGSFVLIFFSIISFNKMILNERINIFKNPKFWICIGVVIYSTCSILVSTATMQLLDSKQPKEITGYIWQIIAYANLLANLLYAVAIIWVPKKKNIITLL